MSKKTHIKSNPSEPTGAPIALAFPPPEPTDPSDLLTATRIAARMSANAARDAFRKIPHSEADKKIQRENSTAWKFCDRVLEHLRAHELRSAQQCLRKAKQHAREARKILEQALTPPTAA